MANRITPCCAAMVAILSLAASVSPAQEKTAPPNRIEQLEDLRKTFAPIDPNRRYGEEDRITLSGVVTTADGAPLPPNLYLGGISHRQGYSGSFSVSPNAEGAFTEQVEFGRIFLHATAPGHAPALAGPLVAAPGGKIENVRLTLHEGFTARVRVLDEQGRPVTGAALETSHLHGEGGNGVHVASRTVATDDEGTAILDHCADYPLTVETRTAGFQYDRAVLRPQRDAPVEWRLRNARPVSGTIVSADTGQPLAGAEVRLLHRAGFQPRSYPPYSNDSDLPLLAKADQAGRFTVDTLRDDCQYTLLVKAPGRGRHLLSDIRAGQDELAISLGPPQVLRGKVTGDLSRLERREVNGEDVPHLRCYAPVKLGNITQRYLVLVPVEVRDGEGYFEIADLLPGPVRIDLPGKTQSLQPTETRDEVVIHVPPLPAPSPQPRAAPRRKVTLTLKIPPGEPAPRGELLVHIAPTGASLDTRESKRLPVGDGALEFDVPVPCRLYWETDHLIGYWIKEESLNLVAAPGPLVKEIEALPAGAVAVQVREPDGSPCPAFICHVVIVAPPPESRQTYLGIHTSSMVQDSSGRFVVGPLPLGGVYRVEIQGHGEKANTRVASEDLSLTREESVRLVELRMPVGVEVAGRVVDSEDQPVAGIQVQLGHRAGNRSHEGAVATTDQAGKFQFPGVNPELGGDYYVHVRPQQAFRGQQTAIDLRDKDTTVRLQRGLAIEGVLLEHRTGKVVPGATVYARPAQFDQNFYPGAHETRTDRAGRFRFQSLEPLRYRFYVNGVNAVQEAPPWEADSRLGDQVILSGDVQQAAGLTPVPPPPEP